MAEAAGVAAGLAWLGLALAVAAGSLLPAARLPKALPNDKALHFAAYFGLAGPPAAVLAGGPAALAAAAILLFGLALECGQAFVPGRRFSPGDLAANAAGAAAGVAAGALLGRGFG